jgi:hypothetical protein
MSCFKVKPRSQVTKSTVKQFGTKKIHIWQPYVLVGHFAPAPFAKNLQQQSDGFFSYVFVFFLLFL